MINETNEILKSELRRKIENTSSRRVFDHWSQLTTPEMAYKLAVAAFSNNAEYTRLKREINYP